MIDYRRGNENGVMKSDGYFESNTEVVFFKN